MGGRFRRDRRRGIRVDWPWFATARPMLLLASYFPYQMSRGEDGAWRFWNRNGYPVGVNLSEDERGWNGLWDPRWSMELPKLDAAAFRKLCGPEWLAGDGTPRADDSADLYGTTSNPGASDENMAAYLERLRVLMEAGALGVLFPYGMQLQKNRSWVFFNRGYKPVGMRSGSRVEYADWPVGVKLTDVDRRTLANLSCTGVYDEEWEIPGKSVHFWEDMSLPIRSARNMDTYLAKLGTLATLDGRTNSKAPWRYRAGRWARKAAAEVKPGALVSVLSKLFRP